jgi:excisionase family DNA binding protein
VASSQLTSGTSGQRLVSIRRAAEILGVNQATVRQWGDSGKVRTFTTPGGHRRFFADELQAMVESGRDRAPGHSLSESLLGSRERYESLARRRLGESGWFLAIDEPGRRRFRILGSSMLNLVGSYLSGGRRERERSLSKGRELAAEYGAESARLGLSLPQATEAFLLFRTPVLESLNRWLRERPATQREAEGLLRRANQFMDQVLVSMAAAHEACRTVRSGRDLGA